MAKAKKRTTTTVTPTTTTEDIKLSDIKAEDEIQQRINTSSSTVEDYTEMIKGGFKFPPLIVYRDPDGDNLLADGFHRFKAYEKAKKESAPCEIREGTREDAMLFAATDANKGVRPLPRTRQDKRRAVETVLGLKPGWTSRQIGDAVEVSHTFVNNVKEDLGNVANGEDKSEEIPGQQQVLKQLAVCVQLAEGDNPRELRKSLREVSGMVTVNMKEATKQAKPTTFYKAPAPAAQPAA